MKTLMPKHWIETKNEADEAAEATSQQGLAALCNAGDFVGLRSIRDRSRLDKVSMGKGKPRRWEGTRGSYTCRKRR